MTERTRTRRFEEDDEPDTAPWADDADAVEEEERPRPRRRPTTRRAEAEEDEAPRKSFRNRREQEDDEVAPPVKRRAKSADLPEETGDEDADGEDTVVIPITRGDDAIKSKRSSADNAHFRWSNDGEDQIVKFLESEPWAYEQHWVTRPGRQSYPCIGKDCPLCDIGVKTATRMVYSILNLTLDPPAVQSFEVTSTLYDTLRGHDQDKKTGPLDRLYWALSRKKKQKSSGSFGTYNYSILPVKERDLFEDYGIDPGDADKYAREAEIPSPEKVLGKVTRRMLQDIADEALED